MKEKRLLTQNAKLKKTSKITGIKTYDFALPAKKTCPHAKDCLKFCYASKGAYTWSPVKAKHDYNLKATKKKIFTDRIIEEIERYKIEVVRIHSSGDFYSAVYLDKWCTIAHRMPHITFYAYTKSISLIKSVDVPPNLIIIFSFGGKQDELIDVKKDRHALVYTEKLPKGYSYANDNDHIALGNNKKIALKLH